MKKNLNPFVLFVAFCSMLLCNGCALVGCESAMPHPAWYWSAEAKRCRESKRMEKQLHPRTENHASRFTHHESIL